MMWYVRITIEVTVAIKVTDLSLSAWRGTEGCSKTFKTQHTILYMSLPLTPVLTFYLLSVSSRETSWREAWREHPSVWKTLLTVDNHVDVFDIRRGDVVAGLAFVATRLVSHDTYNVQVLLAVQRLRCREVKERDKREREKRKRVQDKVNVWALWKSPDILFTTPRKLYKASTFGLQALFPGL